MARRTPWPLQIGDTFSRSDKLLHQLGLGTVSTHSTSNFLRRKPTATGDVDYFPDQVETDPLDKVAQVEVEVIHSGAKFGSKVEVDIRDRGLR